MPTQTLTGFTIDSVSTLDCDDALWVEAEGDKTRLDVHIADVTSQVPLGSYLDQQALSRGETRYLPRTVKPMFPQSLEGSMSLLAFVERPVVTVSMLLDPNGDVLDVELSTGTLVSQAKLDYESVTGILRGAPHHLAPELKRLEQVSQALQQQRQEQGAVYGQLFGSLYIDENGRFLDKALKAQQIIAETMILTNRVVSEYMHRRGLPWIYRTHGYRDLEALPADRQHFLASLQAIGDEAQLRQTLSGYYERAKYETTPNRHEGLALDVYTHFTSPIRRYVDVVNHRLLKAAITGKPMPCTPEQLDTIAAQLTSQQQAIRDQTRERLRAQAQQAQVALLTPSELPKVESLEPGEFSKLLKTAVKQGQVAALQPHILQRLEADTLQPLDFYQVFMAVPTTAENIDFKLKLLAAIAGKPLVLQVVNLLINNWQPGTKVEYREEGEMNAWAALCVVSAEETEQCSPQWTVARSKATARLLSAQQWLESWLFEELVTPQDVQPPTEAIESFKATERADSLLPVEPLVSALEEARTDYVTELNLYAQQHAQSLPAYDFEGSGTSWECRCHFLELIGEGKGTSKKLAKSAAAKDVWEQL